MTPLAQRQRDFLAAVLDGAAESACALRPGHEARLDVHRHNTAATLHDALAATYPVVRRLVGDAFFRGLARRYATAHPSRSGDLAAFGAALASFVEGDRSSAPLLYLGDVARLEWACHESTYAADAPPVSWDALTGVAPERRESVVLLLDASVRCVESRFAIVRLWEANQPEGDGEVGDVARPETALVWRERGRVRVMAVEAVEARFVQALMRRAPLGQALEGLDTAAIDAFLAPALARYAARGIVVGGSLPRA